MSGDAASKPRSELQVRILSSAVLLPVAIAAELAGGFAFAALVAVVAVLAYWEWTAVGGSTEPQWLRLAGAALLAGVILMLLVLPALWSIAAIAAATLGALLLGTASPVFRWSGYGFLYVGIPCLGFVLLREAQPSGWAAILYVLAVVWATDIAAYFGGRAIGGPKLWPRLSPKKTWSGALTGLAAALAAGGTTAWLTGAGSPIDGIVLAAPLSIAAQAGDFFESGVKRRFGVKDSGRIIPGHGGVLDRLDGVFGAAALAWLLALLGLGGTLLVMPGRVSELAGAAS